MRFKENAIKEGMVIHCPKEDDAKALLEYLKELEYVWHSGDEIDSNDTRYKAYEENTCYDIGYCGNKKIVFSDISFYKSERERSITEFSDLIEPDDVDLVRRSDVMQTIEKVFNNYSMTWSLDNPYDGLAGNVPQAIRDIPTACKVKRLDDEDEPAEMTAVEIVDWLAKNYYNEKIMAEAFGDDSCLDELGEKLGAQEIIDKITAYEAKQKAPKPVETEWVDVCRIIKVKADGTKKCVYEEDIPNEMCLGVLDAGADILKKYISEHDGEYIATVESVCRVKKEGWAK